ncbi:D-glycero-beta-D-manno-heptose 1-phosphate adenylyltransferase [Sulfuriferula thiophila]|uniref:D-glycero-beta-D-manno-heptose 1-phosphate adenylyltransferase n=1 Tax=Sulfuriferula thiophila TaxID=1781211 RepID=UPI000F60F85B|nr:D-glycero-beta-D-manno-heptose 1-phosphate adenylyltransferase [Sulfuriferula thiophila]
MSEYPFPDFEAKIATPASLAQQLAVLARPLVFTNGCFDILHRGHVTYLAQARALGAALVVGVNSDASVRRQGKGKDRPINSLANRMAVLAGLAAVDMVVAFEEDTPFNLIRLVHPDVLVKGGDWAVSAMVGSDEVLGWGGQVYSIPFLHTTSTTAMLTKIRKTD